MLWSSVYAEKTFTASNWLSEKPKNVTNDFLITNDKNIMFFPY